MPLTAILLQGISECIASAAFMSILGTGRFDWKRISLVGLSQAATAYIVRLLPLTFGVHTIILIITLTLLATIIMRIEFTKAIITANLAVLIIAVTECITLHLMIYLGIGLGEGIAYVVNRTVMGYPQVIVLFVIACLYGRRLAGIEHYKKIAEKKG